MLGTGHRRGAPGAHRGLLLVARRRAARRDLGRFDPPGRTARHLTWPTYYDSFGSPDLDARSSRSSTRHRSSRPRPSAVSAGPSSAPAARVVRRLGPQRRRAVTRRAPVPRCPAVLLVLFRPERAGSFLPLSRPAGLGWRGRRNEPPVTVHAGTVGPRRFWDPSWRRDDNLSINTSTATNTQTAATPMITMSSRSHPRYGPPDGRAHHARAGKEPVITPSSRGSPGRAAHSLASDVVKACSGGRPKPITKPARPSPPGAPSPTR